jgi:hypothetical protein
MSKKIRIGLVIVFFVLLSLVGAKNQSISLNYSFSNDTLVEKSIDFSSLLLKVSTDRYSTCKYSETKGKSYGDMEGNFDLTYGTLHEKSFTELGDGIYEYYIKCRNDSGVEPPEMEVIIRVNSLVAGAIVLEKEEPLKEGKYEITLITSKIVSQAPSLSYSSEGVVYNPIPLIGSEKLWKGYFVLPGDFGEGVVSFRFKANDLEGREGSEISSGGVYLVDTVNPRTITSIDAVGYKGEIKLKWYSDDEDISEYRIYKSNFQNVDNSDFYEATDKDSFYDTAVKDGETYYYKIAAVDEAGNEGALSVEVYATALLTNMSSSSTGLDVQLIGTVDNFLKEIDLMKGEIDSINSSFYAKQGEEKELFDNLKLVKEIEDSASELQVLRKDVEKYKLQDLSDGDLDSKINSARVRMNVIKKKVPEQLVIIDKNSKKQEIPESLLQESILEIAESASEKTAEKSLKESLRIIKESELSINSKFYVFELDYMDGTRNTFSAVSREISSKLGEIEWDGNGDFIEIIPKDLAEAASEIEVMGTNYQVVKEDPILSFGPDSKKIVYYFNKEISLSSLEEIKSSFVVLVEEEPAKESITGYAVLGNGIGKYGGIFAGVVVTLLLFIYLFYLKRNKKSDQFLKISMKIKESEEFLKKGDKSKASENYDFIKTAYPNLSQEEKKKIYPKIEKIQKSLMEKNEK